ncbi:hypothetical protein [Microlunatus parietis]|uniref:Uncharacterized protein n=1 Tax=Microlunatus parietis TaxID=682979 RepID=A0A7Y9IAI3_9ACTN|nr:hypothetical protein [Microlunatus parietis]NYE73058.1 hypothetical protein [Microlunatus parietis]
MMEELRGSETAARARWAAALLGSAVVLIAGHPYTIFYEGAGAGVLRAIAIALLIIGGLVAAVGLAVAVPLLADAVRSPKPVVFLLVVACVLVMVVLGVIMIIPYGNLAVLMVLGGSQLAYVEPGAPAAPRTARVRVALPFSLAMLALLSVGMLHSTVWNPAAQVPGLSLAEIHGRLDEDGPTIGSIMIGWSLFWGLLVLAFPVFCRFARTPVVATTRRVVLAGLLLVAMVGYGQTILGFAMGLGLGETFELATVGDAVPGGAIVVIVAQFAVVAALFVGCPAWRPRLEPVPAGGP